MPPFARRPEKPGKKPSAEALPESGASQALAPPEVPAAAPATTVDSVPEPPQETEVRKLEGGAPSEAEETTPAPATTVEAEAEGGSKRKRKRREKQGIDQTPSEGGAPSEAEEPTPAPATTVDSVEASPDQAAQSTQSAGRASSLFGRLWPFLGRSWLYVVRLLRSFLTLLLQKISPQARRRILYAGVICGVAALLALGVVIARAKYVAGKPVTMEEQALPKTGTVYAYSTTKAVAPFTITGHPSKHCLVKLVRESTGEHVMSVFITAGGNNTVKAPLGDYVVRCAIGSTWYGPEQAFGRDGTYIQGSEPLEFWIDKKNRHMWGNTLDVGLAVEKGSSGGHTQISWREFKQ
jgi:hypothetical protein